MVVIWSLFEFVFKFWRIALHIHRQVEFDVDHVAVHKMFVTLLIALLMNSLGVPFGYILHKKRHKKEELQY